MNLLTNKSTNKPIILLDASALKLSGCKRRFTWTVIDGYKPRSNKLGVAADYGTAFHRFVAALLSDKPLNECLQAAHSYYSTIEVGEDYRSLNHLIETCMAYAQEYRFDNFQVIRNAQTNEPIVEQKFAIEYEPESLTCLTENFHIVLVGTIDAIGKLNGTDLVLVDHKTTSVWDVDGYLSAYLASPQLKFYKFVLQLHAAKYPDTFGDMGEIGCMINGVFLQKTRAPKFKRSDVFRYNEYYMEEFKNLLDKEIELLCVRALKQGSIPPADGKVYDLCHSHFGACPYFECCNDTYSDEGIRDWLSEKCEQEVFDPRKYGG